MKTKIFISPTLNVLSKKGSWQAHSLLLAIGIFFLTAMVWAKWTLVDEITHAEGKIIPSKQIQRINHLEGGIIEDVLIKEGDIVEKGQLLLKIDSTIANVRYTQGETLYYRTIAAIERLQALIEEREFISPPLLSEKGAEIIKEESNRYVARQEKKSSEKAILNHQIEQKKQEIEQLTSKLEELQATHALKLQEIDILRKASSPKIDLIRAQREAIELKGSMGEVMISIKKSGFSLNEIHQKLSQVDINFKNEDFNELKETQNRLASLQGDIKTEKNRIDRTDVRSPVKGIIKQLLVTTVGSVVKAGEGLLEIVPLEDTLLVEAQVKPADIAFLHPGMKAVVKVTAYNYTNYGGLDAELTHISPDTIQNERHENMYKIQLRTTHSTVKANPDLSIIPGMTTEVAILTGKKSIWDYLMLPFTRLQQNAFTER